ncbi:MAG: hypothetical protein BWY85_00120 [Firmicutes bacterium ADurb.Bin506]|nr:MAG: hypothetical protein BWY85_00120 [Firmicutes bacterium ADurb.Bin506]
MAKQRNPINVWAMVKATPTSVFLMPRLLNESKTQAEHDAFIQKVWPHGPPNNLVIGRYDVDQAVERWNRLHTF